MQLGEVGGREKENRKEFRRKVKRHGHVPPSCLAFSAIGQLLAEAGGRKRSEEVCPTQHPPDLAGTCANKWYMGQVSQGVHGQPWPRERRKSRTVKEAPPGLAPSLEPGQGKGGPGEEGNKGVGRV